MVDNMLECLAAPIIFIYQLFAYVRCKLVYVSSLVILSNFTMCMCFIYSMWKWLALSGFSATFQLLPIVLMGPVLQLLLMVRFTGLMMLNLWTVV
ncbi:uncharacterized protein LOC6562410 isoform X2 [Drosophila grimshawi]|uniref:uncharacterized protein LOC6562410 isoform X2 n=1 Tax=Drosophila grimshawi TaxID=7222 RepID=UPI001C933ADB|nr:uncharacterized protein LOC6562410 isoform X2 [Drosophila grimshawi]